MNIEELRDNARKNLEFCAVCKVCNGIYCAGQVPGMGGSGTGSSFKSNVEDLKKVRLKMRTLHNAKEPDFSFDFFGTKLDMPIIAAPITGAEFNMGPYLSEKEYIDAVVKGSIQAGTIAMIGDSAQPELYLAGLDSLAQVDGKGVGILKPKDNDQVIKSLALAESAGLIAVGMDVDGAGLITMALKGSPVGPKSYHDLKTIMAGSQLPFIIKGVMTVDEAMLAMEVGASAIVVSNHGGRVLDHADSTVNVLADISRAVKGHMMVLVDGGIRSGVDVFKMLALGADAVLVGRPMVTGAYGNGADGVELILNTMKNELLQTMILTGAKDLKSINQDMISVY